jgi:hypothetical protein
MQNIYVMSREKESLYRPNSKGFQESVTIGISDNLVRIWLEADWDLYEPFRRGQGDLIAITPDLRLDVATGLQKILALPDIGKNRLGEPYHQGEWAATPYNAVRVLTELLVGLLHPDAAYIMRRSP